MLVAPGNAKRGVLIKRMLVEEPEAPDHHAAIVGKKAIAYALLLREAGQHGYRVVAYGEDRNTGPLVVRERALQLDELRFTVPSPRGATMEEHQRSTSGASGMQIDRQAVLIPQDGVRDAAAN